MSRLIPATLALAVLAGCSTQVEEAESALYAPVFPMGEVEQDRLMPSGSIYSGHAKGLFAADRRAAAVGDLLTVEFRERFAASKSQAADTSKSDSFAVDIPDVVSFGFDDARLTGGTTRSFSGEGSATQSNSLTGRISVSVVRVLPGGNLEIMGQKKLTLNNGHEYVRVRGMVRPSDISADNVVRSDRIAHAEIKYVGAGDVADTGKHGWLRRALTAVSPM
ncbi:MAG: flagellar basal body L-ring protein FlgH [Roseovarius sp.]|uniref:flagellar basal body L-ring protein FlgH n=1 Tax=Roseovarius sp. TaxID=1486281 RepID=UPI0032EA90AE